MERRALSFGCHAGSEAYGHADSLLRIRRKSARYASRQRFEANEGPAHQDGAWPARRHDTRVLSRFKLRTSSASRVGRRSETRATTCSRTRRIRSPEHVSESPRPARLLGDFPWHQLTGRVAVTQKIGTCDHANTYLLQATGRFRYHLRRFDGDRVPQRG